MTVRADQQPSARSGPRGGRNRRSRVSSPGLIGRQRANARPVSIIVGLLILVMAGLVAAAPSLLDRLTSDEIQQTARGAPPAVALPARGHRRHPASGAAARPGSLGTADRWWSACTDGFTERLADVQAGLPQPLRGLVGSPGWTVTAPPENYSEFDKRTVPAGASVSLIARVDVAAADRVELVSGEWPSGRPAAAIRWASSCPRIRQLTWAGNSVRFTVRTC